MRIKQYIRYTFQYLKRNRPLAISTLIMVGITIAILNIFLIIAFSIYQIGLYIQKQQKVSILFEPLTPQEEIEKLVEEIKKFPSVNSIQVTDSARLESESLKQLGINPTQLKTDDTQTDKESILPIIRIQLKPQVPHDDLIKALKNEEKANPKIIQVIYFEELVSRINKIIRAIKLAGSIMVGFLTLISVYLIYLTMGFTIYQSSEEIKTMQLIGTPAKVIIMPFALQGALIGAFGTLVGHVILLILSTPFIIEKYLRLFASLLLQFVPSVSAGKIIAILLSEAFIIGLITFIISYGSSKRLLKKIS